MVDDHQKIELFFVTRLLSLAALFSVGASIIGQQGAVNASMITYYAAINIESVNWCMIIINNGS